MPPADFSSPLQIAANPEALNSLAGSTSYLRGMHYYQEGLVELLAEENDRAQARVHGSRQYSCELWVHAGVLQGKCSCPAFEETPFCKHLVAFALSIRSPGARREWSGVSKRKQAQARAVSKEEVRDSLDRSDKEVLRSIILARAENDATLMRALKLRVLGDRAAAADNSAALRAAVFAAIEEATEIHYHDDDWPDEWEAARAIDELTLRLQDQVREATARTMADAAEYLLARLREMVEGFHEGGQIVESMGKALDLHATACRLSGIPKFELAQRVFRLELESEFNVLENLVARYKEALGNVGIAHYRSLLEPEWEKLPALTPRSAGTKADEYPRRMRLASMMVHLCRVRGEFEAEAAVHAKSLRSEHDYLKVAKVYAEHHDSGKAISWAERGLEELPDCRSTWLREFLADQFMKSGRVDRALPLRWSLFEAEPSLSRYQALHKAATESGEWNFWRGRAISFLEDGLRRAQPKKRGGTQRSLQLCRTSTLVEILLWEGDLSSAWDLAHSDEVDSDLCLKLAKLSEKSRPADAAFAYRKIAWEQISAGGKYAYSRGVKLLGKVQLLLRAANRENEFPPILREAKAVFRLKRNFIQLVDTVFAAELRGQ